MFWVAAAACSLLVSVTRAGDSDGEAGVQLTVLASSPLVDTALAGEAAKPHVDRSGYAGVGGGHGGGHGGGVGGYGGGVGYGGGGGV